MDRADGGGNYVNVYMNINDGGKIPMTDYQKPGAVDHLRATDDASKAVQKTKYRISLDFIESQIADEELLPGPRSNPQMTILAITLKNGFVVIGKSVPADKLNYDANLGKRFAREDCIRQLWPLFAFALREYMQRSINFDQQLKEPPFN